MEENNQQPSAPTPPPVAPSTTTPPPAGNSQQLQPQPVNKGLVIGIIVAVVVFALLIGGVIFAVLNSSKDSDSSKKEPSTSSESKDSGSSDAPSSANAVTAKYSSDFDAVCDRGSVSNAAVAEKPYKVAVFSRTSAQVRDSWSEVSLDYNSPHKADYETPTEISVVGCLDEKKGTAEKITTCEFTSGGEKTSLDYYAVQYDLVFKEAKTGKELKKAGVINGPATSCPSFVTYNKNDPKLYAKPDKNAVDAAVAEFAQ
jgi:hypothetical protein